MTQGAYNFLILGVSDKLEVLIYYLLGGIGLSSILLCIGLYYAIGALKGRI